VEEVLLQGRAVDGKLLPQVGPHHPPGARLEEGLVGDAPLVVVEDAPFLGEDQVGPALAVFEE